MYQNKKYYGTIDKVSKANEELLTQLFQNKVQKSEFKLYLPPNKYSSYDGLLLKPDENLMIMCEVKRREFNKEWLEKHFKGELFLEKTKFLRLLKQANEFCKDPNRKVFIHYINSTIDGYIYIFDLSEIKTKDLKWEIIEMNAVTYETNVKKKKKSVTKLHINDAIKVIPPKL